MKRKTKEGQTEIELSDKFVPQFWENEDRRCAVVRNFIERYETLKTDCGADSYQKELLCQRATFVAIQLETMEVNATRTGKFEAGKYGNLTNTFLGLLKSLGLERQAKQVESLETYIVEKSNGKRKAV